MKFYRVYKWLPAIVVRTNWVPARFNAITLGFIINMRPAFYNNLSKHALADALLQHELTHVRQWYRAGGLLFWLLYLLWPTSRLRYECEAHAAEIKANNAAGYYPDPRWYAHMIAADYRLPFSAVVAERCLRSYLV